MVCGGHGPAAGSRLRWQLAKRRDNPLLLRSSFGLEPSARIEVIGKVESDGPALTLARWSLDGTDSDGEGVHMEGRGTTVSRRQPDGSWRIALDYPMRPD